MYEVQRKGEVVVSSKLNQEGGEKPCSEELSIRGMLQCFVVITEKDLSACQGWLEIHQVGNSKASGGILFGPVLKSSNLPAAIFLS